MPDKDKPTVKPTVVREPDSDLYDVKIPEGKGSTRVDVKSGSSEHEVLADTEAAPDPVISERRRTPATTQLTVNQPAQVANAGLPGIWGIAMNMTAVVFVMAMFFIQDRDRRANDRERDAALIEQIKLNRDGDEKNLARLEKGLGSLEMRMENSTRSQEEATRSMREVVTEIRSQTVEMRAARISSDAKLDKIITGIKPNE